MSHSLGSQVSPFNMDMKTFKKQNIYKMFEVSSKLCNMHAICILIHGSMNLSNSSNFIRVTFEIQHSAVLLKGTVMQNESKADPPDHRRGGTSFHDLIA